MDNKDRLRGIHGITAIEQVAIPQISELLDEQDNRICAIEDTIAKLQAVIDHFQRTSEENRNGR
jgi:hypothetical protein